MPAPTEEMREKAKELYERTGNLSKVSDEIGIRRATLRAWRDKYNWTVHPTVHVDAQTQKTVHAIAQAQVIDIATRKAIERAEESGLIDRQADFIAESLQEHGFISKLMLSYAKKMMEDAIAGKIYPGEKQSVADVFNSVVTGVSKAVASSRDIAGLKAGQISATQTNDNDVPIVVEQRRLDTVKIPVNERGRMIDAA